MVSNTKDPGDERGPQEQATVGPDLAFEDDSDFPEDCASCGGDGIIFEDCGSDCMCGEEHAIECGDC